MIRMKSPLRQRTEELQCELNDVMAALEKEEQNSGERRYKKIMAEAVVLILFRLDFIGTAVLVLLGMILGHILSNVF